MPIRVTLSKTVDLDPEVWGEKADWDADLSKRTLPQFIAELESDRDTFLDEAGGLAGIVTAVEWVDDPDPP